MPTMTNHTTTETWLRNAPVGSAQGRTATDSWGKVWAADRMGAFWASAHFEPCRSTLPPGTYTLNYREGMQLDAAEAWDYLAGGEGRVVKTDGGREYRIIAGSHVQIRDDSGEWVAPHWGNTLPEQSYTIAPDAQEAEERDAQRQADEEMCQFGQPPTKRDEPPAAPKLTEPDCCREARERVAKLEKRPTAKQLYSRVVTWAQDASREELSELARQGRGLDLSSAKRIAELEETLAMSKRISANVERELDERIADLEASYNAAMGRVAELEGDYESTAAELQEANESVNSLISRVADLCVKLKARRIKAEKERDAAIAERDKLRAEVERLKREQDRLLEQLREEEAQRPRSGLRITLPTDTTTPLDLAQRAVALMGGRVVQGVDSTNNCWLYRLAGERVQHRHKDDEKWVEGPQGDDWADIFSPANVVTLAPEPEPARRELSFGEAVEAIWSDHGEEFSAMVNGERLLMKWGPVSRHMGEGVIVVDSAGHWVRITPAMLAAEWEAV